MNQNEAECQWTNRSVVGVPMAPTDEGLDVVLADSAIIAFTNYLENKTFNFTYDHAIGFFK